LSTIIDKAPRLVRRVAMSFGDLLPSPPPADVPPPDVDGRRDDHADYDLAVLEARMNWAAAGSVGPRSMRRRE
jgi:hypothetical protein